MRTILLLLFSLALTASAQVGSVVRYTLLGNSTLTEDCPICGRPIIPQPLRGGFDLVLLEQNPIASRYAITNFFAYTGAKTNPAYSLSGSGTYEIAGQVAVQQRMRLDLTLWRAADSTNMPITFTNRETILTKPFPLLEVYLDETTPTLTEVFSIDLLASPLQDIWFSIATNGPASSGDLISYSTGPFLRRLELLERLHTTLQVDIDAFQGLPNGDFVFSLRQGFQNFQEGDALLWKSLSVRQRNQELTSKLGIMPLVPDLGLDAYFEISTNEVWFSLRTNAYSETLGELKHGDVLSSTGSVIATNPELLSRFNPSSRAVDYGLDALHSWPHGEIWFSTKLGFLDNNLGPVGAGDLLSNLGYIVFRNHDLLENTFHQEQPIDYGLDAISVVPGYPTVATRPQLSPPTTSGFDLLLDWQGEGVAFQLLKSEDVSGPYRELSPIMPRTSFRDRGALTNSWNGFYRLRQW